MSPITMYAWASAIALSHVNLAADADGAAIRPPTPIVAAANVVIANILSLFMTCLCFRPGLSLRLVDREDSGSRRLFRSPSSALLTEDAHVAESWTRRSSSDPGGAVRPDEPRRSTPRPPIRRRPEYRPQATRVRCGGGRGRPAPAA